MHVYRFVEGDLYEETRESWFEHPEKMTSEDVTNLLVKTWGDIREGQDPEHLIPAESLFAAAGFKRIKPTTAIHLGRSFWPEQVAVDYMNQLIMGIGNSGVPHGV